MHAPACNAVGGTQVGAESVSNAEERVVMICVYYKAKITVNACPTLFVKFAALSTNQTNGHHLIRKTALPMCPLPRHRFPATTADVFSLSSGRKE